MKTLRNGRHEKFAQWVAGGESLGNAYRLVYGVQHRRVRERGYDLTRRPEVKERIRVLREEAEEEAAWPARGRMRYLMDFTKTPLSEVAGGCFCQGVTLTKHGAKIETANKLRAIELHSRLAGDYQEKPPEMCTLTVAMARIRERRRLNDEELAKRAAAERAARRPEEEG
ncbi:hypothetical protein BH09VER1_BH09VER1_30550 [soil metagenome]